MFVAPPYAAVGQHRQHGCRTRTQTHTPTSHVVCSASCVCVSAGSQIIYAFIMMPHTLPQSYVRWIRKQGAKELYVWQGVRVSGCRRPGCWRTPFCRRRLGLCACTPTDSCVPGVSWFSRADVSACCVMWLQELAERTASGRPLGPLTSLMGTHHAQAVVPIPCHFFHPEQACWQHPLQLLVPAYGRALSVYIPVYLLPALLVHRQEFLKQPLPILQKVVQGVARWAGLGGVTRVLRQGWGCPAGWALC